MQVEISNTEFTFLLSEKIAISQQNMTYLTISYMGAMPIENC